MDDKLKNFLQYIFDVVENMERQDMPNIRESCPQCGQTYKDFKATGKLGCASCYQTFRDNIATALKNIHGTNEYQGKIPKGQGSRYEKMLLKRELAENKSLLKEAVEREEFEEAARLRDGISDIKRRLEVSP